MFRRRAFAPVTAVSRPPAALVAAALIPALLVATPLVATIVDACRLDAARAAALLFRPLVAALLRNTVCLVVATACACGVLGTLAAWLVERTDLPGRRVWAPLVAVPLAIPAFITSYAWVSISPALQDFAGAWMVVTFSYFPLVYLPVAAALRGMDPALEESARALGLGPVACFRRVVLPQIRPALFGGMLLVALDTLVEFGAFTLLRFRTFTTELYAEYRTGSDGPEASLLAVVLIALCLVCLALEWRVRGQDAGRYARIGGFTRRAARRYRLGAFMVPALAGLVLLALATVAVPLGTILFWLTQHDEAAFSPVEVSPRLVLGAAFASLALGAAGAVVTTLLALPLGFLVSRFEGRASHAIERLAYVGQGVPGIVVALALITLTLRVLPALYQGVVLLAFAYAIVFLPLALVAIRSAFAQAQRAHEEAARALGLGPFATALRVLLPIASSGIGAAAAMVFVSVVTELTATLLLAPIGTSTLATQVWADTSTLAFAAAAPYAALMAAFSLVSTWALARRFGVVAGG